MKLGKFELDKIYCGDCMELIKEIPDNSIDLIVTDPPYQLSSTSRARPDQTKEGSYGREVPFLRQQSRIKKGFMGKEWDVLPPIEVWKESLRVLKPGAFAFIMTTPRQDSLSQVLMDLTKSGFFMGFSSIYWTYASGFPKAMNIGKMIDKRLGIKVKEGVGFKTAGEYGNRNLPDPTPQGEERDKMRHKVVSPQAKKLEGSYGGFQPKPAVEVIIVAMKPLSEKTYIDQALKNKKGITWLDDGRIPYESEKDKKDGQSERQTTSKGFQTYSEGKNNKFIRNIRSDLKGRFPANLLVSDDVLNNGKITRSKAGLRDNKIKQKIYGGGKGIPPKSIYSSVEDKGSYSRYFDLDKWAVSKGVKDTFPFLIVPKASKSEKKRGLENMDIKNYHPTVKPIKLMFYLIMLGSREGDINLDPFIGWGTTAIACKLLNRRYLGFEINKKYVEIAKARLSAIEYVQDSML